MTVLDLKSYFWSGEAIRSRSVSELVLHHTLDIAAPPLRLTADWMREIADMGLALGDVEPLPLARTLMRWPDYSNCVEAVTHWMQTQGLADLPGKSDVAIMACCGARYHHDGAHYGSAAFCNLFLSTDKGLDLHFPSLDLRIPLSRGTVVIFDTAQPHAVIQRHSSGFDAADFAPDQDYTQLFLSWELPIENPDISRALQIDFDIDPVRSSTLTEEQVCLSGAPAMVCPATGTWMQGG